MNQCAPRRPGRLAAGRRYVLRPQSDPSGPGRSTYVWLAEVRWSVAVVPLDVVPMKHTVEEACQFSLDGQQCRVQRRTATSHTLGHARRDAFQQGW